MPGRNEARYLLPVWRDDKFELYQGSKVLVHCDTAMLRGFTVADGLAWVYGFSPVRSNNMLFI
jgi:hypothetical protein